jgi:hypothetical protein
MLRIRCRFSEHFMRRILLGLILLAASLSAHPFDRNRGSAQAQQIVLPCVPSGNSCIPVSAANPLPTTGGGGGGSPGGSNTQVQYNNSSSFGGTSAITTDGTNATIVTGTGTLIVGAGSAITSSGPGGVLGSNAFNSTAYAPLASPTFTGTVTLPDSSTWTSGGIAALTALGLANTAAITWSGRGILTSSAAGTINLGAADVNGSPVAQIVKAQSALAGSATNTASPNTTIIGALATGTGTDGDIIFQTGVKTTTGTAQATATTALTVKGETQILVTANGSREQGQYDLGTSVPGVGGLVLNLALGLSWGTVGASTTSQDTFLCRQSSGVVGVGTTSCNTAGSIGLANITASGANVLLTGINATTETDMLCYNTSTGLVTHSTVAQQCTVSDMNKKRDVEPISPQRALDIALAVDPIWFHYRPEADMGSDIHAGFTMQRVAEIEPRLATETGVKYGEMNPIWAGSIQALQNEIEELKRRLP